MSSYKWKAKKAMSENRFTEDVLQYQAMELLQLRIVNPCCGWFYHPQEEKGSSNKGLPDILGHVIAKDNSFVMFFIELKTGNRKPSTHQKDKMEELKNAGYVGIVAYNIEHVDEFILNLLNNKNN